MNRYLIYFSYIGTQFRGVQKQYCRGIPLHADQTIQSILENALLNLKKRPLNVPVLYPASRTDQGVHALCTAAHVDLEFFEPPTLNALVSSLNNYCTSRDHDIRVLGMQIVPSNFSARYCVIKKHYLYRFAVIKPDVLTHMPLKPNLLPFPILEKNRCYFHCKPDFDYFLAQEATNYFIGKKDFRAFMRKPRLRENVMTNRHIDELTLCKGSPLIETPESEYYDFWEVSCIGKSFLYQQVRRIVGTLIAIGRRKITYSNLQDMFTNPTNDSWDGSISVVPGYGLYLINVHYKEEDLLCEADSKEGLANNNII